MENKTEIAREILYEFLEYWTIDKINSMTLEEYVSVGDKNTFCQWLETKTRGLGSIKGINSSKFGIYKRGDTTKTPKNLKNDEQYSWQKFYGETRDIAFENVKKEILKIIEYSEKGEFEKIDNLHLTLFVKWKIAYLFSNERLIPIFKKSVLHEIAKNYGLEVNNKTQNSEIQDLIIKNKPSHISIYEFAEELYDKFGRDNGTKTNTGKKRKSTRKGTTSRNTKPQKRKGTESYIASQKHNLIQGALYNRLVEKYGEENVILEENYVDIKVKFPNKIYFYEVKSSSYASDCIKEALGQIISYSHKDSDSREKYLFVVGQYKPNENETEYLNFIKDKLSLKFDYINVELKE